MVFCLVGLHRRQNLGILKFPIPWIRCKTSYYAGPSAADLHPNQGGTRQAPNSRGLQDKHLIPGYYKTSTQFKGVTTPAKCLPASSQHQIFGLADAIICALCQGRLNQSRFPLHSLTMKPKMESPTSQAESATYLHFKGVTRQALNSRGLQDKHLIQGVYKTST